MDYAKILYSCSRHFANYSTLFLIDTNNGRLHGFHRRTSSPVPVPRSYIIKLPLAPAPVCHSNIAAASDAGAGSPPMAHAGDSFVLLRCFDGEEFRVPSALARRSGVVAAGMDAGDHAVPVPDGVTGRTLAAVIAYWVGRDAAAGAAGTAGRYDEEYVAGLSHDVRVDVINAAYHLSERGLFELFAPPAAPCA
ncbi:hypothetical protein ACP70R_018922 [Stipagrostis hirtigluma subsp. patula]